ETEQPQLDGPFKISNIGNPTNLQAVSNSSGYALTWEANGIAVANLNIDDSYMFVSQYTYASPNNRIGQWQQPLLINNPAATAIAGSTTIAASNSGYAFVWQQTETDGAISFYSRILNNTTWSDIELLSQRNLGDVRGKASITSKDNIFSVLWLQAKNNTAGNNDIYLNRFNGANWETTPTRVSNVNIPGNQEKFAVVNESDTLLALWTQNDPSQFSGRLTKQLLSKQVLSISPTNIPMTPATSAPQSLAGSIVGRNSNYVYATNQASLAVFNIDSLGKTLTPVDAQPLSTGTIENYTVTASSAPATDNLSQTVFVATSTNRLNAYPIDRKTGELLTPKSVAIGASNNIAVVTHQNGYVYVLSRSLTSTTSSVIKVFRYFAQTKSLTPISALNSIPTNTFQIKANPSDIIIHPSGKYLYVTSQGNKSIGIYSIKTSTGELSLISDHPQNVATGAIINYLAISNDGNYLYVSDQLALRILDYAINNDGTLSVTPRINNFSLSNGGIANNIIIHPSGKYLYNVTNQNIQSFKISAFTGALTFINTYNSIGLNSLSSIRGLAVSPDGRQLYVSNYNFSDLTNSAVYIFDINQINDINNNLVPGGLYSPGKAAPGNSVQSGQNVTSSKVGRCEI
ncbi:MAG: beta-propeller fold lactonase family protein, partial [Thiohalomonadales bacterium]